MNKKFLLQLRPLLLLLPAALRREEEDKNNNDITIFKSVGLGFQDLVIAELVLDRINR